jgi:hypothetical protein
MKDTRIVIDAFADARRTWDDLVSLQPDIYAGAGNLDGLDLAELARRVDAHRASMDALSNTLQTELPGAHTEVGRRRHP